MKQPLTRTLTGEQAINHSAQILTDLATSMARRADNNAAPRFNAEAPAPPAQSISAFNAGVRAANRNENLVVAGADTAHDEAPAAPNFNASVMNLLKRIVR